jgi:hypothetical protein
MQTIQSFSGATFTPDCSKGWDFICPPHLGRGHASARVGAVLELTSPRGDVGRFRAVVTGTSTGQSTDEIYIGAEVTECDVDGGFIRPGTNIRITDTNSWLVLGGPCNVDPFGFSGTIAEVQS